MVVSHCGLESGFQTLVVVAVVAAIHRPRWLLRAAVEWVVVTCGSEIVGAQAALCRAEPAQPRWPPRSPADVTVPVVLAAEVG